MGNVRNEILRSSYLIQPWLLLAPNDEDICHPGGRSGNETANDGTSVAPEPALRASESAVYPYPHLWHDSGMTIECALQDLPFTRADGEVLLAAVLGCDRADLLTHPERELTADQERQWNSFAKRRAAHEPVAYITETRDFYGRSFRCDSRALIPRPSTETLVELTLDYLVKPRTEVREADSGIVAASFALRDGITSTIVDVGTGTGSIAVTLACERPDLRILATDISSDALALAEENAHAHGVQDRITFLNGDLLDALPPLSAPFLIVSNLPYIRLDATLPAEVSEFEPRGALLSGVEGTDALEKLAREARTHPRCCGLLVECMEHQLPIISRSLERI
ncbi:MAG: peptide chain release factor N(5)-glutamine methyltransferase [Candidatus Peregrinibacteria bacterium]|nr:peptide chain release factor N(5)-glutamine methyltransferase [Candidatus Peregrinibacteria bacterium]